LRREHIFLLGVLLCAATLRFWAIADLPPGLFHDEAAEGVDALRILREGARPAFLPGNNGREPAFAYVVAAVYAVTGSGALGLRLAAAFLGVFTVPLTYLFGRRLFNSSVGLLTAFFIAVSPWHLHLSRLGLRPVILPMVEALAFYCLWRAYQTGRLAWWAVSGVALGATLYTYMPARMLLGIIVLPIGATIARRSGNWRQQLLGPLLLIVTLLVSTTPLVTYFMQHPEDFIERAQQVSFMNAVRAGADPVQVSLAHLQSTMGMFLFQGDTNPRHNLPGKPVFDWFQRLMFILGLGVLLLAIRKLQNIFILLWLLVGLVPAVLSDSAPHFLRASGLLPALMVLPAIGFAWLWHRRAYWRDVVKKPLAVSLVFGLTLGGVLCLRDYFFVWPALAQQAFQAERTALIGLGSQQAEGARIYYATREVDDPVVKLISRRRLIQFHPDSMPARVADGPRAVYLVPSTEPMLINALLSLYPGAQISEVTGNVGQSLDVAPGIAPVLQGQTPPVLFGEQLQLISKDIPASARSGGDIAFTVAWRPIRQADEDVSLVAFLRGPDGEVWRQTREPLGLGVRSSSSWNIDEITIEQRRIGIPGDIVPGIYELVIGLELESSGRRLDAANVAGAILGPQYVLGSIDILKDPARPNLALLPIKQRTTHDFGGALRMVGYNLGTPTIQAGSSLAITLFWETNAAPLLDYEMRLQVLDITGMVVAENTSAPARGQYPTTRWRANEVVRDYRHIVVGGSVLPGRYLVRLDIIGGGQVVDIPFDLDHVVVTERPPQAVSPAVRYPLVVNLGGSLRLLGYDVANSSVAAGSALPVTLYWQAQAPLPVGYTVFVHLLDDAQKVVAQHDGIPQGGRLPTTGWLPGEVVPDVHELRLPGGLPPGQYYLEIGMYDATSGVRLPVSATSAANSFIDDQSRRILLAQITVATP
jgi:4-amino-4-deoxy-L-arabinose transferase-like glycosyltransferase